MITRQDSPFNRIRVVVNGTTYYNELLSIDIQRGGNYGPYTVGPDVGTATISFYYKPGVTIPSNFAPNKTVVINSIYILPSTAFPLFTGTIVDVSRDIQVDPVTGAQSTRVTLYATDGVAELQAVTVPGILTATRYQTAEERINALNAYAPSILPTTSGDSFAYRLVDNNLVASLSDHLDLLCRSINSTWYINTNNQVVFLGPVAPLTGMLFTDVPGYWNSGNYPANAGTITAANIQYSDLSIGFDTANVTNEVVVRNIMPKNMITNYTTGALRYKDPTTTPAEALEVIETSYTVSDATSISNYGRRSQEITTNLYPYKSTDAEAYYVRYNSAFDPGNEYQNTPTLQVVGTSANATVSNVTPRTGTYCTNITVATAVQSFGIYVGPSSGYPLKVRPTSNTNPFQFYFRTSIAKARYRRGISYLDSAGNVLLTQVGTLITPTVNVWGTTTATFMNFATIPAGAVAWRPYFNIETSDGTNFAVGDVFKIDDVTINPVMDPATLFSGDTADTTSLLSSWESAPGASASIQHRNIQYDIGTATLTQWGASYLAPTSITWNATQDFKSLNSIIPTGRVDIRNNGTSYTSWINSARISIDTENIICTLSLGTRPSSWI